MCHCHEDRYKTCETHVDCDERNCTALKDPQTLEEYKDVLEHYKLHSHMHGCPLCAG